MANIKLKQDTQNELYLCIEDAVPRNGYENLVNHLRDQYQAQFEPLTDEPFPIARGFSLDTHSFTLVYDVDSHIEIFLGEKKEILEQNKSGKPKRERRESRELLERIACELQEKSGILR